MPRFRIELDEATYDALCAFAEDERRKPTGQAEWMLRQAVQTRVKQQAALRHMDGMQVAEADTDGEG